MGGGIGNDILLGATGNDTLDGGPGIDFAKGGAGADLFVFSLLDGKLTISDFDFAEGDRVDLAPGLDAATATVTARDGGTSVQVDFAGQGAIRFQGLAPEDVSTDWFV
jgi:hypothetical protein